MTTTERTRLKNEAAQALSRAGADRESAAKPLERDSLRYLTLLDAVDAALARRDDGEATARIAVLQAYAAAWAALGYGLWLVAELMVRLVVALARAIVHPRRRRAQDEEDGLWVTTMKKKGRVR